MTDGTSLRLVPPHQLFVQQWGRAGQDVVIVLIEHDLYFRQYSFHSHKLASVTWLDVVDDWLEQDLVAGLADGGYLSGHPAQQQDGMFDLDVLGAAGRPPENDHDGGPPATLNVQSADGRGISGRAGGAPAGEWTADWKGLYWAFADDHRRVFAPNPRSQVTVSLLDRMSQEVLGEHRRRAAGLVTRPGSDRLLQVPPFPGEGGPGPQ